ncbi:MAG: hypothetical protein ACRYFX_01190 [Janthinobacterium lividum]
MEPTPTQPTSDYTGSASSSSSSDASSFSTTAAHATGSSNYPIESAAPASSGIQGVLDNALSTGKDALASGKKWLADSGLADQAQQLPQTAKDLGTKAWERINGLSNTQKAVGVGLLAAGIALLATRSRKDEDGEYRHVPRRSPFAKKQYGPAADDSYAQNSRRSSSWGGSRYGSASSSRVSSGSGHSNDFGRDSAGTGRRRDQGPSSGSRYDASRSGGQNPNNEGGSFDF